ncbi:Ig-like domain repeat protein [Herbaspirillum camelliae]|uniref:Ig-like domain repeat protein n=1 Tax=Herbaspirillum camelliae TaxID=1892903 RepID=UPI000949CC9C|nr:Ig-like domain repeat protein [Herbaspirillum camelliae]
MALVFLLLWSWPAARAQTVTALPDALVGVPYSATFTPHCGGCYQTLYSYDNWDSGLLVGIGSSFFDLVVSGTPTVAGTSTVTLDYFDAKRNPIGSAKWTITAVVSTPTSISLGSSSTSPAYGAAVTLTANLAGTYAGSGTVSFMDGAVTLGTVAVSSYTASLDISTLAPGSHALTAVFDGDATSSAPLIVTVAAATPTLSLGSSASSISYGGNLLFNAALSNGYSPSGSIEFHEGGAVIGSATLAGNAATLALGNLTAGAHLITARYAGDGNNAATSSSALMVTVSPLSPTLLVSTSSNAITYGATPMVTATLTGVLSPGGTILFKDGSAVLGTAALSGDSASLPLPGLAVGSHAISAVYSGDNNHDSATASATTLTVGQVSSTVVLNASTSHTAFGAAVTLTATVGGSSPSGTVTFTDGGVVLGSAVVSAGAAVFSTSTLAIGTHSLEAQYDGDSNNAAASSAVATVTVIQRTPALVLSASSTSVSYGATLTLNAALSGGSAATGLVRFTEGGVTLGAASLSGGAASLRLGTLTPGTHIIRASYAGDSNHAAATSSAITVTINKVVATLTLSATPASASLGSSITFNAVVSGSTGSLPGGTVVFSEGGTTLATVNVVSGAASFSTSTLALGSHTVTAHYSGDSNNASANSTGVRVSIGRSTPTLSLASSASALNEQAPLTLTATVAGGIAPTGTVSFMDGAAILGTVSLSGQSASLTLNTLTVGSHRLSAVYNGDSNNNSTGSASVTVAVASIRPAVTGVTPAGGSALGNTRVSISGVRLAGASAVSFGGSAARIVSNSDTELVVVTSAHTAGTVDLVVTAAGGTVTVAGGFSYAILADPASSTAVTAMVRAQTQAVQRFATAHLANFTQRLELLHGEGAAPSSFGLSFGQTNDPRREPTTWARGGDIVNYRDSELAYLRAGLRKTALAGSSTVSTASTSGPDDKLPELPQVSEAASRRDIAWWIGGALDLVNQKGSAGQSSARLSTSGVSMGGDYRISRGLTLGMGAGYSLSGYRADDDSASSRGQGVMGVLYASTHPADDLYVDALAGYGALRFELSRFIADTGALAAGSRTGRQVFGSTTVGYEWRGQDWLVSPYVRLDLARATLDRYTESGGAGALTYFSQSLRNDAAYLGMRAQFDVTLPVGLLTPQARMAYQRNLQGTGTATMSYADSALSSPVYRYSDATQESRQWLLTLGGRLLLKNGLALMLLYSHNAANAMTTSQSLNFQVSGRF